MYRKRQLSAVVAASCLLLTATACDNDPDAQSSTTPSSTPSSTPTPTKPTATPPTMPPAAQSGLTVTSAEAFARFYVAAMDYAAATGNTALLHKWAEKNCQNCRAIAEGYETTYRSGGSFTGQLGTRIVDTEEARLARKNTAIVAFKALSGRVIWRKSATATPTVLPGDPTILDFTLVAAKNHWTVFELELKQ